jgi:YegS/Rv2252/BmrU family lipid kinase
VPETAQREKPLQIDVIINAKAGASGKEQARELLADIFKASGIEARISLAKSGAEVMRLAERASRGEAQTIVAGGGDGTLNTIASALIGTSKTFGVLPLGTLNHFAKDLRIPLSLTEAARAIIAGYAINIDVGEVNGRIFLNNSSLGLYPSIVRQREKRRRLGYGKWFAFLQATISVLRRYPFLDVRLRADGQELSSRTPFVFIGNNEYDMESLNLGGRACLDAGKLSLYITHRVGRLGLLRLALWAFLGRLREEKDFISLCTTEVWIETRRRRLRVATDGEVAIMEMPLRYRVLPGALRVIVPASNEAENEQEM